jgi:hypothetical protein
VRGLAWALTIVTVVGVLAACEKTNNGARSDVTTTVVASATKQGLRSVTHAMVVAVAIKAARIGCDHPMPGVVPQAGSFASGAITEQVDCVIGDDNIVISLFRDQHAMTSVGLSFLRQAQCFLDSHGSPDTSYPPNVTYVAGENWIVFPESKSTAETVATAIGGSLRTSKC